MAISKVVAAVIVVGVGVTACSSAPSEGQGQSSEALVCPSWGCNGPPIHLPTEVCVEDPGCWITPRGTGTYDPPYFYEKIGNMFQWVPDTDFVNQLTAMGCSPEMIYMAGNWSGLPYYGAFCPEVVSPAYAYPCDQCTGAPPPGWTFMIWTDQHGTLPGGGCHETTCEKP